ncbi:MAG: PQQ-like beta-propeller repeat protein [Deltaproteobacteria bacterium]|nr:PQQ-like beta-propeller repeat protein [Deltaproteobacteria bacterium]
MKCLILSGIFLSASLASAIQPYQGQPSYLPDFVKRQKRPFRLGVIELSRKVDRDKPLGAIDFAGWAEQGGILVGAPDHKRVIAFSLRNGQTQWVLPTDEILSAPPLVLGEFVYLGLLDGTLMKVDIHSGKTNWKVKLNSFASRAMVKDNYYLYVVTANQTIYAVNLQEGRIEWLHDPELPEGIRLQNLVPPVVYLNKVYLGISTGEILSLDAKSGALLWRRNPQDQGGRFHDVMGKMVPLGKLLAFCRYDGLVGAISLETGNEGSLLWSVNELTGSCADSDFREGRFYVGTVNGDVGVINITTGKPLWIEKLGIPVTSISAAEEYILVASSEGDILALNTTGSLEWRDFIGGRVATRPIFFEQSVYFSTGLKNLYGYRL